MRVDLNKHEEFEICTDWYYCPNCNVDDAEEKILKKDYKFCPYCGIKLEWGD